MNIGYACQAVALPGSAIKSLQKYAASKAELRTVKNHLLRLADKYIEK